MDDPVPIMCEQNAEESVPPPRPPKPKNVRLKGVLPISAVQSSTGPVIRPYAPVQPTNSEERDVDIDEALKSLGLTG